MASRADDLRFRDLLNERLGPEATNALLERLPAMPAHDLATKHDLAELRGELLDKLGELKGEIGTVRGEIGTVRGELGTLRGEFGELRGEFGELRAEIADKMRIQTWYMAGVMLTGIGTTAGVVAAIVA